jgi:hypothetical protein
MSPTSPSHPKGLPSHSQLMAFKLHQNINFVFSHLNDLQNWKLTLAQAQVFCTELPQFGQFSVSMSVTQLWRVCERGMHEHMQVSLRAHLALTNGRCGETALLRSSCKKMLCSSYSVRCRAPHVPPSPFCSFASHRTEARPIPFGTCTMEWFSQSLLCRDDLLLLPQWTPGQTNCTWHFDSSLGRLLSMRSRPLMLLRTSCILCNRIWHT